MRQPTKTALFTAMQFVLLSILAAVIFAGLYLFMWAAADAGVPM